MIRSDFHMHTAFSGDCKASAREMIEGALKRDADHLYHRS